MSHSIPFILKPHTHLSQIIVTIQIQKAPIQHTLTAPHINITSKNICFENTHVLYQLNVFCIEKRVKIWVKPAKRVI